MTRARVALEDVALHPHEVDPGQKVIHEGDVISAKLAAVHRRVEGTGGVPEMKERTRALR